MPLFPPQHTAIIGYFRILLSAPTVRHHGVEGFGERACATGSLGRFRGKYLMPMMMGYAGKLQKFGA